MVAVGDSLCETAEFYSDNVTEKAKHERDGNGDCFAVWVADDELHLNRSWPHAA